MTLRRGPTWISEVVDDQGFPAEVFPARARNEHVVTLDLDGGFSVYLVLTKPVAAALAYHPVDVVLHSVPYSKCTSSICNQTSGTRLIERPAAVELHRFLFDIAYELAALPFTAAYTPFSVVLVALLQLDASRLAVPFAFPFLSAGAFHVIGFPLRTQHAAVRASARTRGRRDRHHRSEQDIRLRDWEYVRCDTVERCRGRVCEALSAARPSSLPLQEESAAEQIHVVSPCFETNTGG